jgi:hypothetical protein
MKTKVQLSFVMDSENIEKYLDLPNLEDIAQIIGQVHFCFECLTRLKTKKHFEIFEKIQKRSVAQCYLNWELELKRKVTDFEYFQWRLVFDYWIKGDQKQRIREIRSPAIINMLKIEFPAEIRKLLQYENS